MTTPFPLSGFVITISLFFLRFRKTQCWRVILKLGLRSISKKITSHIFKHLHFPATCFDSYSYLFLKIIDKANSKFHLKIKEALYVNWRKPKLNAQQNHLALTLSLKILFPLLFSVFICFSLVVFCNSLSSIVFIISTLIMGTFYCLSYTLLLLHLFITRLVIDFIITM